jgi:hypothetical protein
MNNLPSPFYDAVCYVLKTHKIRMSEAIHIFQFENI